MHSPIPRAPASAGPEAEPDAVEPDPEPAPVERLSRNARVWRSVVLIAGTLLIIWGSVFGSDDAWPFGPMSQFAFRTGPNDMISSTYLQARTVNGDLIIVPITPRSVGIGRAEVEGQHVRMEQDPRLLGALFTRYNTLHPNEPALAQLWLKVKHTNLHQGKPTRVWDQTLVGWPVNDH